MAIQTCFTKAFRVMLLGVSALAAIAAMASLKFADVRIMVVVPEVHINRPIPDPAGETAIVRALLDAGYHVIDQTQTMALRKPEIVDEILHNPTGATARNAMAKYGANMLIVGQAFSEYVSTVNGVQSCRAHLEATVIMRDSAEIVAKEDGNGSGADLADLVAAKTALGQAGAAVAVKLLLRIGKVCDGPTASSDNTPMNPPTGKPVLAVFPFDNCSRFNINGWDQSRKIPDLINMALLQSGKVDVVELTDIDQILQEKIKTAGGIYDDPNTAAGLGGLTAAQYVIMGRIMDCSSNVTKIGLLGIGVQKETDTVRVLLKIINVHTGKVLAIVEVAGDATSSGAHLSRYDIPIAVNVFEKSSLWVAVQKAVTGCVAKILDSPIPKICPKCQKENKLSAKFCSGCGYAFPDQTDAVLFCPKCHAHISATDKFCPECGAPVNTDKK